MQFVTNAACFAFKLLLDDCCSTPPVGGPNQIGYVGTNQLVGFHAQQSACFPIREQHFVVVHEHNFGHGIGKVLEQILTLLREHITSMQRLKQLIETIADFGELSIIRKTSNPAIKGRVCGDLNDLLS